ncbi:MAG: hypothetical protein WC544_03680 [Patescibacteria group bacterium]
MKDFFKPTWAKIVVALFFPLYFGIEAVITSGQATYHTVFSWMPFSIFIIATIALWANTDTITTQLAQATGGEKLMSFVTELVLPLCADYMLACLTVWLFKKLKVFFFTEIQVIRSRKKTMPGKS